MKKDIFNFKRFGKYFKSDIRTCTANYGLPLITLSIFAPILVYVLSIAFSLLFSQTWHGPVIWIRAGVFVAAMFCMLILMPVRSYGKLTEKQYGSQWLMIPASRFEKFLSMIILSCLIVPLVGIVIYFSCDALICALDHTCGDNLIRGISDLQSLVNAGIQEAKADLVEAEYEPMANFMTQITSPWLYVDEIFGITLPFLLGALVFKKSKTVKTFLALFAFSTLVSIISTPLMIDWTKTMIELEATTGYVDPLVMFDSWIFQNIVLIDIISDTVCNLALLTAIYFRIKTLKH